MRKTRHILQKVPAWLFTVVTVGAVLWLTLAPRPLGDEDIPLFPGADKIAHALMFGFLTVMILLDWQRAGGWRHVPAAGIWTAALSSTALGVAVEFMQRAMHAGRGFEVADMVADGVGALLAALLWRLLQSRWSRIPR